MTDVSPTEQGTYTGPYLCTMSPTLLTIALAIGLIGLSFAGIAVKIWAKKDGEFSGTCASNNPLVQKEGASCGLCGARPEEKCRRDDAPSLG